MELLLTAPVDHGLRRVCAQVVFSNGVPLLSFVLLETVAGSVSS